MNEFKCVVYSETGVWWDNFIGRKKNTPKKEKKKIHKKCEKEEIQIEISLHKYPINEWEKKIKKYWLVFYLLLSDLENCFVEKPEKISENLSPHTKQKSKQETNGLSLG